MNPLIIEPEGDFIKCVLDARRLNSNTEQSDESWPIEHLAPQLACANKILKYAIVLRYANAHTHFLTKKHSNLQVSLLETNSSLSYEAFLVPKVIQNFLQNKYQTSLRLLLHNALLSYTLMIIYFFQFKRTYIPTY